MLKDDSGPSENYDYLWTKKSIKECVIHVLNDYINPPKFSLHLGRTGKNFATEILAKIIGTNSDDKILSILKEARAGWIKKDTSNLNGSLAKRFKYMLEKIVALQTLTVENSLPCMGGK